jgi:hypothetical protein
MVPADEIKMLKAYKGEVEKLGVPERFLYTMAKIPKVEARLQGFVFKQVICLQWVPGTSLVNVKHTLLGQKMLLPRLLCGNKVISAHIYTQKLMRWHASGI